jgi:DNA-binding MarR family transcriptional regulator
VLEETAELTGAVPPEELTAYIGYLLRRVHAQCAADGGPPREYVLLDALAEDDARSQQSLARRLDVNRTVMVRLVDRLEDAGLVARSPNPANRRSHVLSITAAGRATLAALSERDARLTAVLTAAERGRLRELLRRLVPGAGDWTIEHLVTQAHLRLWKLGDSDPALVDAGLRVRHFGPLSAIDAMGPCPQQALARKLAITEPAAAELVDPLVKAGLVARGQDRQDRRRYALELTPLGRARLALVRGAVLRLDATIRAELGSDGHRELRELLRRLLPSRAPGAPAGSADPT